MEAIVTKELRSRMRGARAFVVITIFLALLSCFVVALYGFTKITTGSIGGPPPPLGRIMFYTLTGIELLLIAPLAPAFSAGTIAGEKERQTFDLMVITPVTPTSIVLGKVLANLAYIALLIVVALPIQVLSITLGGLTLTEVMVGLWILLLAAVFYGCVSVFFSSFLRSTTLASVFSYLVVALNLIGAIFIVLILGILGFDNTLAAMLGPTSEAPSKFLLYVSDLLIAFSPVLTAIVSETALVANGDLFLIHLDLANPNTQGRFTMSLPSPWIIYSVIYIVLSVVCVWLSIRNVRPVVARNPRNPSRPEGYTLTETMEDVPLTQGDQRGAAEGEV